MWLASGSRILTVHFNFSVASFCPALLPVVDLKGFRIRLDRQKGLKLVVSKPGLKIEITAGGNPKAVKHFRVAAEKMIRALAQAK
jgi:hypothetical protein